MPEEESPQAETLPVVLAQHDVVVAKRCRNAGPRASRLTVSLFAV